VAEFPRLTIDREFGSRYVYLSDHPVARTISFDEDSCVMVDMDEDGNPVGVEFA